MLCQWWCVVHVTPCLRCTNLTVSSHSASSTSNLQHWLTSTTLQTRCSSSHVLIPPSLSGALSHSTHLVSSFRDNKCSGVGSLINHCWMMMCCASVPVHSPVSTSPYSYWFTFPFTFDRPVKTSTRYTYSCIMSPSLEYHTLSCSTHVFLQLNYLITAISNSQRAWTSSRDATETMSGFYCAI